MSVVASNGKDSDEIRVLVAAREAAFAPSLREDFLKRGLSVCASAHDAAGAVAAAVAHKPDVCVLVADLPGSAVVATARITHLLPRTRVVILAPVSDPDDCITYVMAGAAGYVERDIGCDALAVVLHAAMAGEGLLPAAAGRSLLEELRGDLLAGP